MGKLKLLGMATEPYCNDNEWEGATIYVLMEAGEHRLEIRSRLSCNLLTHFQPGDKEIERFIMKRVENGLDVVQKKYDVTPKDINTICEIVRLKMQRFIHKSALRICYVWNAVAGYISEDDDITTFDLNR